MTEATDAMIHKIVSAIGSAAVTEAHAVFEHFAYAEIQSNQALTATMSLRNMLKDTIRYLDDMGMSDVTDSLFTATREIAGIIDTINAADIELCTTERGIRARLRKEVRGDAW